MRRAAKCWGAALFFALLSGAFRAERAPAQELNLDDILPALRDRAIVLSITTKIAENQEEIWNAVSSKITLPGQPVYVQLKGSNLVINVRLTLYPKPNGSNVLVAQGQIWVGSSAEGQRYKYTFQMIPLKYGELVYFFPLGAESSSGAPNIQMQIELNRYADVQTPAAPANPEAPEMDTAPAEKPAAG